MANPLDLNQFESTQLIVNNNNSDDGNTIILILVISFSIVASMVMKTRQANELLHSITSIFQGNCDLYSIAKMSLVEEEEENAKVVECVVCLCQVVRGERYKILPNCNHGFHARCIDAWLKRHATCPLCRSSVTSISYRSIMNQDNVEVFDVLFSRFVRVVDHLRAWLVNPISPSMESALGHNCLSFI